MFRSHLFVCAAVATLSACVSGASRRPGATTVASAATSSAPNTTGPWRVPAPSVSQKVFITTQAVVTITGDVGHADTLQATLGASYVWAPGNRRKVDGLLSDYRVGAGSAPPAVPGGLQLSRPFSAEAPASGGALSFRLPAESSACTDPTLSALQGLHDAWIPLPDPLVLGREWSDTVHTLSCRDRIPLRGESVRRFQARRAEADEAGRVTVLIERTARTRLAGEGDQFGERVGIDGQSTGTMRYVLDPVRGRLVRASGTATLSFSLRSSRRNQVVHQESQVTVVWAP